MEYPTPNDKTKPSQIGEKTYRWRQIGGTWRLFRTTARAPIAVEEKVLLGITEKTTEAELLKAMTQSENDLFFERGSGDRKSSIDHPNNDESPLS